MGRLVDAVEREKLIKDLDTSYCVEASAGTGKTTILIGRLISIIEQGRARLPEVVAITFTEKAAGELADRLKSELEKRVKSEEGIKQERFLLALEDISLAHIQTIHSFAGSLLRRYPLEAGLRPDFEVVDEAEREVLLEKLWQDWLQKEMLQSEDLILEAMNLGLSVDKLKELAYEVIDNREYLGNSYPGAFVEYRDTVDEFLERFISEVNSLVEDAKRDCVNREDQAYQQITTLQRMVKESCYLSKSMQRRFLLKEIKILKNKGNKKNWQGDSLGEFKQRIADLREDFDTSKEKAQGLLLEGLLGKLASFAECYRQEKKRLGVLDFDDLLLLARDLLVDNLRVRQDIKEQIRFLFVDEFQDTDPVQAEIVFLLANEGNGSWQEGRVVPGRLFIVGDPKQSIYRFRKADIEIYEKAKEVLLASKGELIYLRQNFRTVKGITTWVNETFAQLLQDDEYNPEYRGLFPVRDNLDGKPVKLVSNVPDEKARADEIRSDDVKRVIGTINKVVLESWQIFDKEANVVRNISYRDMAILFPTMTGLNHYEDEFRRMGIPYRIAGGKYYYQREELRGFLYVLKAIRNPYDSLAIVGALRSPFFSCSDRDIFEWKLQYPLTYRKDIGEDSCIANAFKILRDLSRLSRSVSVVSLFEAIFQKTRILEKYAMQEGKEQAILNLRKVIDQANDLSYDIDQFIIWLERRVVQEKEEGEALLYDESIDAVNLMTVHKSKGLEYPMIILVNLHDRGSSHGSLVLPNKEENRLEARLGDGFQTSNYSKIEQEEQYKLEAERKRLFYVAVTRARDYLVLISNEIDKPKGFEQYLSETLLQTTENVREELSLEHSIKMSDTEKRYLQDQLPLYSWSSRESILSELVKREELLPKLKRPSKEKDDIKEYRGGSSFGLELGSAFHQLMQDYRFWSEIDRESLEVLVDDILVRYNYSHDFKKKLMFFAYNVLESGLYKRVLAADAVYRELPFSYYREGELVEGTVDLVFVENEELVIVDYKTDYLSKNEVGERVKLYSQQGQLYKEAVEKISGKRVKEVVFEFVELGVSGKL